MDNTEKCIHKFTVENHILCRRTGRKCIESAEKVCPTDLADYLRIYPDEKKEE